MHSMWGWPKVYIETSDTNILAKNAKLGFREHFFFYIFCMILDVTSLFNDLLLGRQWCKDGFDCIQFLRDRMLQRRHIQRWRWWRERLQSFDIRCSILWKISQVLDCFEWEDKTLRTIFLTLNCNSWNNA